jgi:putative ABC transport system permease protein
VRGSRTRDGLVIAEVALSVILLVGASLTIRGFVQLQQTDLGFRAERVLMVDLPLPAQRYSTAELRNAFARDALDRVRRLPGVESAALGNAGFPYTGQTTTYAIPGQPVDEHRRLNGALVGDGYATVMGIPVRAGRDLSAADVLNADRVVLINESAAKLWPTGQDPIGQTIQIDRFKAPAGGAVQGGKDPSIFTVVGIVGDTKNAGLENDTRPAVFAPYTLVSSQRYTLVVRTRSEPMALLNSVRAEVRAIDPEQPLARVLTLEDVIGFETVQPRFNMALFGALGAIGLVLSAAGIFSVLSYHVTQRTHEIGVRMALGASRGDVLGLMIGRGGRLVAIGLVLGIGGSFALARFLQSAVFRLPATDPISMTAAVVVLSVVALFACYLPARRATKVDPMIALRAE